ncbi:hypothetical protein [Virgibacillus oceani]|uniref:Uncharacterized protein n=1 Tax=Virgibacillus oceani TaxID=1479511 RepID=A0A917LY54_9BACI|nr:hypothetical protein [Virgibacillus oceani]GGG64888.1 hypothetical protein GCM10011398_05660 [Virgibacillus oceani]
MEKIIKNHLVGFGSVIDMQHLEDDYYGEFTDAGMTVRLWSAYDDMPDWEDCDRIYGDVYGKLLHTKYHR